MSLNHFGSIDRLDVLRIRHGDHDLPRWTPAVRDEITNGACLGFAHCARVLAESEWLAPPAELTERELRQVYHICVALGGGKNPPEGNEGEAESILVAERCDGIFLTDDNGAYDFAYHRSGLGNGRVMDSIEVLRQAVLMGELTCDDAAAIAGAIEDNGRSFRRVHSGMIGQRDYFSD